MYYINDFLEHLKKQGFCPYTIVGYKSILKKLNRYLADTNITDIKNVTEKMINNYFKPITDQTRIKGSEVHKIIRTKIYFKYLVESGKIFISPMRNFVSPKYYTKHYPTLSQEEMENILESIDSEDPLHIKARTIMELMYSCALRPREVYNLKLSDIDYNKGLLFLEQSKSKKDRIVPVGKTALFWLSKYIKEIRPQFVKNQNHGYVFVQKHKGKPLNRCTLYTTIRKTLTAFSLPGIKPYSIRSTAATILLLNGMSVEYVSKLLGHARLNTTKIYLRVNKIALEKVLNEKHPRIMYEKNYQTAKEV